MYAADSRHRRPPLQDKLRHLYTLRSGPSIDLTIRPDYYTLLGRLGDPHKKLPPVIHVAGTNGKGSTIATLRAILEAAERRVHAYTSPHLRRFNVLRDCSNWCADDRHLYLALVTAIGGAGSGRMFPAAQNLQRQFIFRILAGGRRLQRGRHRR